MNKIAFHIARVMAALILLQTLYFKFSAHPDSVHIFSEMGVEPWGRISLGVIELVAAIALFIPRFTFQAALLSVLLMLGAIGSHVILIGVVVNNDGGLLFTLALITLLSSAYVAFHKFNNKAA